MGKVVIPTPEEKKALIDDYMSSLDDVVTVAKRHNLCDETLHKYIRELGLPTRKEQRDQRIKYAVDYYQSNDKATIGSTAKKFNVGDKLLSTALTELGLRKKPIPNNNFTLKHNFFDAVDTEEKAYFVGFIFADGCVSVRNNKISAITIALNARDRDIIDKFSNAINNTNIVSIRESNNRKIVSLSITSEQMANSLCMLGVMPQKTYKAKSLPQVPEEFIIPMLRGFFDGDGGIHYSKDKKRIQISATAYSEEIVKEFQQKIDCLIQKDKSNKITGVENKYNAIWNGRTQSIKILHLLYDDAEVYLNRKYDLAQQIFADVADATLEEK